jgi:hypothetical protein
MKKLPSYSVEYHGEVYLLKFVSDVLGNPCYNVVEGYSSLEDEGLLETVFLDVVCLPGLKFITEVGLAGRMGGVKFSQEFDNIEDAALWGIEKVWDEFLSPEGQYHGIDAIR